MHLTWLHLTDDDPNRPKRVSSLSNWFFNFFSFRCLLPSWEQNCRSISSIIILTYTFLQSKLILDICNLRIIFTKVTADAAMGFVLFLCIIRNEFNLERFKFVVQHCDHSTRTPTTPRVEYLLKPCKIANASDLSRIACIATKCMFAVSILVWRLKNAYQYCPLWGGRVGVGGMLRMYISRRDKSFPILSNHRGMSGVEINYPRSKSRSTSNVRNQFRPRAPLFTLGVDTSIRPRVRLSGDGN